MQAIKRKNTGLCLAILGQGIRVYDTKLRGGRTFLHMVCDWGDLDVLRALLERAADANVFDHNLLSPLHVSQAYCPIHRVS